MIADTLYAKYIKEREDTEVLENQRGFLTFKIIGKEMIIVNLYVDPIHRKSGCCLNLIQELEHIAIDNRCDIMTGNIHLVDPGANITLQAALRIGFKIHSAHQNIINIYRKISGGHSNG